MILKDVGTVARRRVGQGAPAGPGARIMRITTDAGSFETPARLLTASEHRARSEASISRALPHEARAQVLAFMTPSATRPTPLLAVLSAWI